MKVEAIRTWFLEGGILKIGRVIWEFGIELSRFWVFLNQDGHIFISCPIWEFIFQLDKPNMS